MLSQCVGGKGQTAEKRGPAAASQKAGGKKGNKLFISRAVKIQVIQKKIKM